MHQHFAYDFNAIEFGQRRNERALEGISGKRVANIRQLEGAGADKPASKTETKKPKSAPTVGDHVDAVIATGATVATSVVATAAAAIDKPVKRITANMAEDGAALARVGATIANNINRQNATNVELITDLADAETIGGGVDALIEHGAETFNNGVANIVETGGAVANAIGTGVVNGVENLVAVGEAIDALPLTPNVITGVQHLGEGIAEFDGNLNDRLDEQRRHDEERREEIAEAAGGVGNAVNAVMQRQLDAAAAFNADDTQTVGTFVDYGLATTGNLAQGVWEASSAALNTAGSVISNGFESNVEATQHVIGQIGDGFNAVGDFFGGLFS